MMWVGARGGSAPAWRFSAVALPLSLDRALAVVTVGAGSGVAWATGVVAMVVTRSSSAESRACAAFSSTSRWPMVSLMRPTSFWISVTVRRTLPTSASALLAAWMPGSVSAICGRCVSEKSWGCHAREARYVSPPAASNPQVRRYALMKRPDGAW
jgi:hypothetical protein